MKERIVARIAAESGKTLKESSKIYDGIIDELSKSMDELSVGDSILLMKFFRVGKQIRKAKKFYNIVTKTTSMRPEKTIFNVKMRKNA